MKLSSTFLIESKSARDEGLQAIRSREPEQDILNKVKSLMFAVWDGSSRVSRQQLADFYEVPVLTIDSNYQDHRSEFESDGVNIFKGKDLRGLRGVIPLSPNSPKETVYTATGALFNLPESSSE